MVSSTSWETLVPMSKEAFSHWVTLAKEDAFFPWRRIVPLILVAKLGNGHPGDEEADFQFGWKRAGAAAEAEAAVVAAVKSGQLTLLGPDSHFPITNPGMRPGDAVVARSQLVSFLASHGIGVHAEHPTGDADFTPASSAEHLPARQSESTGERQDRRLARFHELGGALKRVPGAWNVDAAKGMRGALAKLVAEEKAAHRLRSDRKDISADLTAAMERRQCGQVTSDQRGLKRGRIGGNGGD